MIISALKSLMRLFGIVANISKPSDIDTAVYKVNEYLHQITNPQEAAQYLQMFEFHARQYQKEVIHFQKRLSVLSVKGTIIAEELKGELLREEKILIIAKMLEIFQISGEDSTGRFDFIGTMASIFNVHQTDYQNCKALVFWGHEKPVDPSAFYIINGSKKQVLFGCKHSYQPELNGELVFLSTTDNETILFKYQKGEDKLHVNDRKIHSEQCYLLSKGASIRSYKISPVYYTDVSRELLVPKHKQMVNLQVINASYKFSGGSTGIQPFSLYEEGGQLIGIMGSSGAGKTTLLNLLNGNLKPTGGKVMINGKDLNEEKNRLTEIIGYVPQDDLLLEELTVYQNLYYNARLCFKDLSDIQINDRITHLLVELELYEAKDLVVGNPLQKVISGGQRKRLNLALELIREPSIFFIDEPTSGLSSNDAEKLMLLLKKQALQGTLMMVNIHQPSSDIFKQFDKIIILDQGGYIIFNGNPLDAATYFKTETEQLNAGESECISCGNVNPEQILSIIEQKRTDETGRLTSKRKYTPADWHYKFTSKQSSPDEPVNQNMKLPEKAFQRPGKFEQFRVFFERNLQAKLRDNQYLIVSLLEAPLLALILAYFSRYTRQLEYETQYLFFENENLPVYLFMSVIVAMFLGLIVSAEQIIQDRKILQREKFLQLSRASYLHSKIIFLFILSAIQTFTFVIIGNALLGIKGMNLPFWVMLFTVACNANLVGLNISSAFQSLVTIYILIPILLVPQLLLSGASLKFDSLPASMRHPTYVPLIGDLIISRWAYEGLMVYQFKNNAYQENFMDIDKKISKSSFMANYMLPELENTIANLSFQLRNDLHPEEDDWNFLINEIQHLEQFKNNPIAFPQDVENLDLETANNISSYLKEIRTLYTQLTNFYITEKDLQIEELRESGTDLVRLKEKNVNNRIADIVTGKDQKQKFQVVNNELIRKMEPVFFISEATMGRSHLYASWKKWFSYHVDTFWFNVTVIWMISTFLYIFLQLDALNKILNYIHKHRNFSKIKEP